MGKAIHLSVKFWLPFRTRQSPNSQIGTVVASFPRCLAVTFYLGYYSCDGRSRTAQMRTDPVGYSLPRQLKSPSSASVRFSTVSLWSSSLFLERPFLPFGALLAGLPFPSPLRTRSLAGKTRLSSVFERRPTSSRIHLYPWSSFFV